MSLFITGCESFIGRRVLEACRQSGYSYTGIDLVTSTDTNCRQADINSPRLAEFIPEGTETVIHLAAVSRDVDCRNDVPKAVHCNVQGTANVIQAAEQRNVRQIIFASTEWVYGQSKNAEPQTEDQPIEISQLGSEYAMTKAVGEQLLRQAVQRGELPTATILRFGIVYGPRPDHWSAVESLFHSARQDQAIEVGSLNTARRFTHVGDIASAILHVTQRPTCETFNVAGQHLVSLGDILRHSSEVLGRKLNVKETMPDSFNIRNPVSDRLQQTGWKPQFSIRDGLNDLKHYFECREASLHG